MTDNTSIPVKIKGRKRATFALLLSFSALGLSGYLYYMGVKAHAHTSYQLVSLDNAVVANSKILQQNFAVANNQIDALKNKVDSFSTSKFSANNYQINTLISLATQSLVAYHDVNAAIKLLSYAQSVIDVNNQAIYTELKVAITTDLDRLKQLPVIDRVVIATKLNNIITSTDTLDLIINNESAASVTTSNYTDSKWTRFLNEIKIRLFGLVQITNANNNNALNLLPQNSVIIHQNIKLDILNARMALLQNDEVNWEYSLSRARQGISSYFINNTTMNNVMDEIAKLQQLNISYNDVGIEQTLKALNQLNNLEK